MFQHHSVIVNFKWYLGIVCEPIFHRIQRLFCNLQCAPYLLELRILLGGCLLSGSEETEGVADSQKFKTIKSFSALYSCKTWIYVTQKRPELSSFISLFVPFTEGIFFYFSSLFCNQVLWQVRAVWFQSSEGKI